MNLKNIFFKNETTKKENEEELSPLHGPKVIIHGNDLLRFVGKWLWFVSDYAGTSITSDVSNKIKDYFGHILSLIGYSDDDTCTLSNLDEENKCFECHFNSTNDTATIRLCYPGDFGPQIRIKDKNDTKTYFYYGMYNNNYDDIKFDEHDIETDNGTKYERRYTSFKAYISLKDDEKKLDIEVEDHNYHDDIFLLPNEEEIKKYFCELNFPIDLKEVYKKLSELTSGKLKEYAKFELKNTYGYNKFITDYILLNNGVLEKFIITRDGITITINRDGSWKFYSSDVAVAKSNKGSINYSIRADSEEEMEKHNIPNSYDEATNSIEEVRTLIKSLNL